MSLTKFSLFVERTLQFSLLKKVCNNEMGCFFMFVCSIGIQPTADYFEKKLTFFSLCVTDGFYGTGKNQQTC